MKIQDIKEYLNIIPRGKALDLGCGNGNWSLFLANNGFNVIAIDNKDYVIDNLFKKTSEEQLSITTQKVDFRNFSFSKNEYSIILAMYSLCFLKRSDVFEMIKKMQNSVTKSGFIIMTLFTPRDAMFDKLKRTSQEVELNSFENKKGETFSFFLNQELKDAFDKWHIIECEEKEIKDPGHVGYENPHSHYIIQLVAQKIPTK
ncbi:MAG: methyltransferase domain-containing protein [Patescibacteria group bacterium]|nr:methyltransferase domain-containing protein [Patescibacteria group bacterium]